MPAALRLAISLPGVGPNIGEVPMPLSISTIRSPVLSTMTFCSSTTLLGSRKLSVSIVPISSFDTPEKVPDGSPSGRMPSETTVPSKLPSLKR